MKIPSAGTVLNGAFATDGGSISLLLEDSQGRKHSLLLSQHSIPPTGYPGEKKTGRLYFNNSLVPVRSAEEAAILSLLRNAAVKEKIRSESSSDTLISANPGMTIGGDIREYYARIEEGPYAALQHLLKQVLDYVLSEEYVVHAVRP